MVRGIGVLGETGHEQESGEAIDSDAEKQPGSGSWVFWRIPENDIGGLKERLAPFYIGTDSECEDFAENRRSRWSQRSHEVPQCTHGALVVMITCCRVCSDLGGRTI